jgi:D-glycero-D-manno-heptose 1,7-bisphosphate phosphatase
MTKLIILDRDGVINQDSDNYIRSAQEFIPLKGSIDAIVRLSKAGFKIGVASNQSGIGRGFLPQSELDKMWLILNTLVEEKGGKINHIAYCPHTPDDNCECRKPKTGLYQEIAKILNADLTKSIVIGDSFRDVEAGLKTGAKCYMVRTGKGEKHQHDLHKLESEVLVFDDLNNVTDYILKNL